MFGAKKLPELARGLGQGIREFKGAVDGVKNEIEEADKSFDEKKIKLATQKLKIKNFLIFDRNFVYLK